MPTIQRTHSYFASYEDAAKVEAAAKKRGFTGNDGKSWHDFVDIEQDKFRTGKQFWDLQKAEDWLKSEVSNYKSVCGSGKILLQEPVINRCSTCVCGGLQNIREYLVYDTGIADTRVIESMCLQPS
jgi:hypothetical protein